MKKSIIGLILIIILLVGCTQPAPVQEGSTTSTDSGSIGETTTSSSESTVEWKEMVFPPDADENAIPDLPPFLEEGLGE